MRATPVALAVPFAFLAACSDASRPSLPTAPELSVTTAVVSRVELKPSDNIQAKISSSPPGTTFLLRAGTYRRWSVIPRSGDSYIGERGARGERLAILDGENVTQYAFQPGPNPYPIAVRIQGLIVQRYNPPAQFGAVLAGGHQDADGSNAWVVEDNEIRYNATGGLRLAHNVKVLRNYIHHNGQIGISGVGINILVEGNEIAYNNYQQTYQIGWAAGGAKFANTRGLVVRGNFVHHNHGNGLWNDLNSTYTLLQSNRVEDNAAQGIFYEISYDAVIRDNVVRRNGAASAGQWLYGAGILVANSRNVQVYGNTVEGNVNGIAGIQQNRGTGTYGPYLLQNLVVLSNTVTMTRGATGVAQSIGDNSVFTIWNNRFQGNAYSLGTNAKPFRWMNAPRTEAEWRAYGQDVAGTFSR